MVIWLVVFEKVRSVHVNRHIYIVQYVNDIVQILFYLLSWLWVFVKLLGVSSEMFHFGTTYISVHYVKHRQSCLAQLIELLSCKLTRRCTWLIVAWPTLINPSHYFRFQKFYICHSYCFENLFHHTPAFFRLLIFKNFFCCTDILSGYSFLHHSRYSPFKVVQARFLSSDCEINTSEIKSRTVEFQNVTQQNTCSYFFRQYLGIELLIPKI